MSNPIFGDILHAQSGRRNPGHYIGLSDRECAELDAIADEHDRKMRRLVMERRRRVDRYVDEGIIPQDEREHMYELAEEDDVILQTCVPSSSYNRLVFCRKV